MNETKNGNLSPVASESAASSLEALSFREPKPHSISRRGAQPNQALQDIENDFLD